MTGRSFGRLFIRSLNCPLVCKFHTHTHDIVVECHNKIWANSVCSFSITFSLTLSLTSRISRFVFACMLAYTHTHSSIYARFFFSFFLCHCRCRHRLALLLLLLLLLPICLRIFLCVASSNFNVLLSFGCC